MKKFIGLLLASTFALLLAAPGIALAADAKIKVNAFDGAIKITYPTGESQIIVKGKKVPWIPFSSKVQVLKGSAKITIGASSLLLNKDQGVLIEKNSSTGTIEISALGTNSMPVVVTIGDRSATLNAGQVVMLVPAKNGNMTLRGAEGVTVETVASPSARQVIPEPVETQPNITEASPSIPQ